MRNNITHLSTADRLLCSLERFLVQIIILLLQRHKFGLQRCDFVA